jgi:hypothetical protein
MMRSTVRRENVAALVGMRAFTLSGCSRSHAASRDDSEPSALAAADGAARAQEGGGGGGGAGRPFGAPCVTDAECAAGACFHKHVHDSHGAADGGHEHKIANEPVDADGYCSLRCSDDGDCPVPPTAGRCGGRGMCKK